MKVRVIPRFLSLVIALGVAAAALSAHVANVEIEALAIDGTTLTITGKNFGSTPAVFVGDDTAAVSNITDTEIVAVTPQLGPGVHIVKVVRDQNEGGSAKSTLLVR